MKKLLKLFGLACAFTVFLWVFNVSDGVRADSSNVKHGKHIELPNTTDAVPQLYVNGNLQTPIASSQQDALISFCSSKQEWKLLQEYTEWDNVNRFGYYTDLGVGHNTVLVFRGPDSAGAKDTTYISAGTRIGLWLLNDENGNLIYDGNDSYLFSERMLTRGSVSGEHQWFMVYDVSAFKGTGATYFFDTFTEDFTTTGDFDYLIFIDDDHTSANMDHNDMIVGALSLGNPPVITAPDSNKILCNPDTIRFTVTATDVDAGDSLTLQKTSGPGTFNTVTGISPLSGQLKYYVSASGTYNFIFKAMDKCGKVDYDTATWTITMNSTPVVTAPDNNKFICSVGDSVNFTVTATDPNAGQSLTLEKTSGPGTFATVNGTSPLSGTQKWAPSTAGTYNFIYKVTDACGAVDYDTATWVIT
ncbi:MAG TPA: hypothetical protein VMT04_03450, partial [Terriglobales bacterium]|nr:hypothetical protein [Terriglobales bacterium]